MKKKEIREIGRRNQNAITSGLIVQNPYKVSAVSSGTCAFSHSVKLHATHERVNKSGTMI